MTSAYTQDQVYVALRAAGFPPNLLQTMDAIGGAESSWLIGCIQQGEPYSTTGWGTWQITPGNSEPLVGVDDELLPIRANARAAWLKYKAQGLDAWSTWKNGAYRRYLR